MNFVKSLLNRLRKPAPVTRATGLGETDQNLQRQSLESERLDNRAYQQLEAIFQAGQKFIESSDENEIIELVLRLVVDLTGVAGVSFVPLDEHGQPMAAVSYGDLPFPVMKPWLEYLASPAVRSRCRVCDLQNELTTSCPLLKGQAIEAAGIYCIRLRRANHEYGVFNLYVPENERLDSATLSFLGALVDQTALAVEGIRLQQKELAARDQLHSLRQKADLLTLVNSLVNSVHQLSGADLTILAIKPHAAYSGPTRITVGEGSAELQAFVELVLQGVFDSGKPYQSASSITDPRSEFGSPAYLAVPLIGHDFSTLGAVLVSSQDSQGFSQQHLNLIQNVANQLTIVIESTNRITELEYRAMMQERSRLAREIHDGLAQTLGYLKLQAAQLKNTLARQDFERLQGAFSHYYETLSVAYQDARYAIDGLRLGLSENGLSGWLEESVIYFREISGLPVTLRRMEGKPELASEVHAQLMRIVQEAFSNIHKHAHASQVWIDYFEQDRDLWLLIQDNGAGFAPEDISGSTHHGLNGMRERADLIGADFQVISRPGEGTTIRVRLPISSERFQEVPS